MCDSGALARMKSVLNTHFSLLRVRPKLSCLRDAAPLLELDRDERKLEAFLQLHKHDLLVADLRIFLPFTINLDPYLRKVLKEDQQAMEDEGIVLPMRPPLPMTATAQQRMVAAGHYPMMSSMMHPNAMDPFGQQSVMPYTQPYMSASTNPSFTMPGFVANNFPASSTAQPAEPIQRKKSIIENINPFTAELRNQANANEALGAFPVSQRPSLTYSFGDVSDPYQIEFPFRRRICCTFAFRSFRWMLC